MAPSKTPNGHERLLRSALLVGLFLAPLAVFGRSLGFGFVDVDDGAYVLGNPIVLHGLTWAGCRWALTTLYYANYQPTTWLSHMLDVQLWNVMPGGHHATSVALHALNGVLVFWLLFRLTGATWRSALVGALFAIHPLRAESVCWISERKDVLSGTFFLLTLLGYLRWVEKRSVWRAAAVLLAFAIGLMAKAMLVTTPLVLLLLDRWPLRRTEREAPVRLAVEKLPLFALSALDGLLEIAAQHGGGAVAPLSEVGLLTRVMNSSSAVLHYLGMTAWPAKLGVFYPLHVSGFDLRGPAAMAAVAGLFLGTYALRRRAPHLFMGWCWFVLMLMPTLGLLQVGLQARADRYTYLPHLGLFVAIVWCLSPALSLRSRRLVAVVAIAALVALGLRAFEQAGTWRDSTTLFRHLQKIDPQSAFAEEGLARLDDRAGRTSAAAVRFETAIALEPTWTTARADLARIRLSQGRFAEAISSAQAAVRLRPTVHGYQRLLAEALRRGGRPQEALHLMRGVADDIPSDGAIAKEFGIAAALTGNDGEALPALQHAVRQLSRDPEARMYLAIAYARAGRLGEAERQLLLTKKLDPHRDGLEALIDQVRRDKTARAAPPPQALPAP